MYDNQGKILGSIVPMNSNTGLNMVHTHRRKKTPNVNYVEQFKDAAVSTVDQFKHKPDCTALEDGLGLEIWDLGSRGIALSMWQKQSC